MILLQNTSIPKAQGTLRKRSQEDCEKQRIREFSLRLCTLVLSEATAMKSHQCIYQSTEKAFLVFIEKFISFCSLVFVSYIVVGWVKIHELLV